MAKTERPPKTTRAANRLSTSATAVGVFVVCSTDKRVDVLSSTLNAKDALSQTVKRRLPGQLVVGLYRAGHVLDIASDELVRFREEVQEKRAAPPGSRISQERNSSMAWMQIGETPDSLTKWSARIKKVDEAFVDPDLRMEWTLACIAEVRGDHSRSERLPEEVKEVAKLFGESDPGDARLKTSLSKWLKSLDRATRSGVTLRHEKLKEASEAAKEAVDELTAIDLSTASSKQIIESFRKARKSSAYLHYLVRTEEARIKQDSDSLDHACPRSPDAVSMAFAEQLITLRKRVGLTQVDLARKCGIPQPQISRYERGKELPSQTSREKLAKALEVRVTDLIPSEK